MIETLLLKKLVNKLTLLEEKSKNIKKKLFYKGLRLIKGALITYNSLNNYFFWKWTEFKVYNPLLSKLYY